MSAHGEVFDQINKEFWKFVGKMLLAFAVALALAIVVSYHFGQKDQSFERDKVQLHGQMEVVRAARWELETCKPGDVCAIKSVGVNVVLMKKATRR